MAYEPTVLKPIPQEDFVETPYISELTERSLRYLAAGFPVHYRGAAGTGKTCMAMHIACKLDRPVVIIHGDDEFATSDLIGGEYGYTKKKEVDNFIHSVLKSSEDVRRHWVDNRLTVACKYGFTLIYDEFTRSKPEANNVLLSVLEENMLPVPGVSGSDYIHVNPDFHAIFTSNPEEYAGVHKAQDALRDRLITMDLSYFDRGTEIEIVKAKSGLAQQQSEQIVDLVREFRKAGEYEFSPTIRACVKIAQVMALQNSSTSNGTLFRQTVFDVLTSEIFGLGTEPAKKSLAGETLNRLLEKIAFQN
ncbi:gas vesicle protein GvpN [bacterium]|nr:gas vesicle protein GvpN [bacterium]